MNGRIAKKLRREFKRQIADALTDVDNFVEFVNRQPLKNRLIFAWKILTRHFEPIKE